MDDRKIGQHAAYGYAAFLAMSHLISLLIERGVISHDDGKTVLDKSLLSVETSQAVSSFPEMSQATRMMLEALLKAGEQPRKN